MGATVTLQKLSQLSNIPCRYAPNLPGMKNQRLTLLLLASVLTALVHAETVDWQAIQKLAPYTSISIETQHVTFCYFQRATSEKLYCDYFPMGRYLPPQDQRTHYEFNREEIRNVRIGVNVDDDWKGFLSLFLAAGAGGGFDAQKQPTTFAGIKIGGPFAIDLQYDRLNGQSGFSTEGSGMLPIFRVPGFHPGRDKEFVKVFAEPGIGYRAGGGPFGGYTSAKALVLLLSDNSHSRLGNGVSPYFEFQRRFPFNSPLDGDNRLTMGIIWALCWQCGVD
ncbi:MAG: hypothetical protein P4K93_14455 [Terracidiphilus sp.]|nr:hypothetical protein [Terracidiphilus sp.]